MYVLLDGYRPAIKKCIRVLRDQRYDVDLLLGEHLNVWEHIEQQPFCRRSTKLFWHVRLLMMTTGGASCAPRIGLGGVDGERRELKCAWRGRCDFPTFTQMEFC